MSSEKGEGEGGVCVWKGHGGCIYVFVREASIQGLKKLISMIFSLSAAPLRCLASRDGQDEWAANEVIIDPLGLYAGTAASGNHHNGCIHLLLCFKSAV